MGKLSGKVAVVTGGNSGIGFQTAKRLKEEGAEVVIIGRSKEKVDTAASELKVRGVVADVQNVEALSNATQQVKQLHDKIDILFVNAGVYFGGPIGQYAEETFDSIVNTNFKGAVYTVEKFLPLIKNGGSIVGLSTMLAGTGMAGGAIYSASKAAFDTYLRAAVTELADRKIRVNNIKPGPINTPIYGKTGMPEDQLSGFAQSLQNKIPLKTFGSPEDIANTVLFVVSDEAKFINGAEINVDGGLSINPILS